jgi:regulator of replication initiation timing
LLAQLDITDKDLRHRINESVTINLQQVADIKRRDQRIADCTERIIVLQTELKKVRDELHARDATPVSEAVQETAAYKERAEVTEKALEQEKKRCTDLFEENRRMRLQLAGVRSALR